jgi:hypothetical protein
LSIEELQASVVTLRGFQTALSDFGMTLRRLQQERDASNDWMIGPSPSIAQIHSQEAIQALGTIRDRIARDIDHVSGVCDRYGLPYVWKLYPPPAVGGLIRTFNVFRAFIDLDLEAEARPTLLQVNDLVKQAIWRCEQEIAEASAAKPFHPIKKLAGGVSLMLSWFFPSEKQRLVLGWIIIVILLGLMLRYIFGLHLEDMGKLIVKWVFTK